MDEVEKMEVVPVVETIADVTQLKKMRRRLELRISEKEYRVLFENIKDGIVVVEMDGRVLECNQTYAGMLGYSKDELKKLTYQQLTPKRWHQMEDKIRKEQVMKRGYSDEYEKEYIRKDGTVFPISTWAWLIRDENGKPKRIWGIIKAAGRNRKEAYTRLNLRGEMNFPARLTGVLVKRGNK